MRRIPISDGGNFNSFSFNPRMYTPRVLFINYTALLLSVEDMAKLLSLKQKKLPMGQEITTFKKGVYNKRALLPPGIRNSTNNSYANSILQCLCNNDVFRNACTAAASADADGT